MPQVDPTVFVIMICLPIVATWAVLSFFRRQRRRRRRRRKSGRAPQETTWGQLITGNLLILLMLFSYLMLGGELYFRYWYEQTDSFGLTLTTNRWFLKHYQMNGSRWRDNVEYPLKPEAGKRRVTFVGDSFTVGHGIVNVEDRFANIVRRQNPEWDVQVLASNGWDTKQELELLENVKKWGSEIDLVVLVYCLNDISDIVPQWQEILDQIYEDTRPGYVGRNSYLFNTIHYRWIAASNAKVGDYFKFTLDAYTGPLWQTQRQRLLDLRQRVHSNNGRLAVVTFPFVHALGDAYPFTAAHDRLDQLWSEQKVPHLDLTETFAGQQGAELVVNRFDAHPNEKAHAQAAEAISAFLRRIIQE